jgi:hypothetical protein
MARKVESVFLHKPVPFAYTDYLRVEKRVKSMVWDEKTGRVTVTDAADREHIIPEAACIDIVLAEEK